MALAGAALAASLFSAMAQGVDPLAPSSVNPKPVQTEPAKTQAANDEPYMPSNPEDDKPISPDHPDLKINAIVIVKSRADISDAGVPDETGIDIRDIPFLSQPDFKQVVEPFLGKLITPNRIRELCATIIKYSRKHGKILVDAIVPEQDVVKNGVLQLWFLEGKVGNVTVRNDGRKWFKDTFILDNVRLRPGDGVSSKTLTEDLNWLNSNPFRQVDVAFKPGEKLGLTDVELDVNDRIPVRPYLGYEDSGTRFTGPDRLLAGFNWGNAFGLDHQLNYQYSTDVNFDLVKAHSGSYLIPLPWRHTIMLYGAYVDGKANFGNAAPTAAGISWQASGRYSVPLPQLGQFRQQISAGFDFKRSNNNLEFGGTTVLQRNDTDIAQFLLGYSGIELDRYGNSSLGLEAYYSPGGLTDYDDNNDYGGLRIGARSEYFYARLSAERVTHLPFDFSWVLRGWGQVANQRLLPSEELAMGGYDTIRGYDERVISGDDGWIINNEIRTPPILLGNLLRTPGGRDELQFLTFFDYGETRVIDQNTQDLYPNTTLYSFGGGLRFTVNRNLSVRFDYGYPLTQRGIDEHLSRAHIGVLLSY